MADSILAQPSTKGRLIFKGHNISMAFPVIVEARDDSGNLVSMDLAQTLQHLDNFDGHIGNVATGKNLLDCCFSAYEYGMLTPEERELFEAYARNKINAINPIEAAKRILIHD